VVHILAVRAVTVQGLRFLQ